MVLMKKMNNYFKKTEEMVDVDVGGNITPKNDQAGNYF